jgi:RNA polymerase sigma-B factor
LAGAGFVAMEASMGTATSSPRRTRRPDEDAGRFRDYRRHCDRRLRDQLFVDYLPLAESCARRYRRRGEPDDDLMQVAGIGLLKAIERYDPARGTCFSSYAVPTIVGELQRHFRDHSWTVRPPRGLQEDVLRMERERAALVTALGREPTAVELAHAVGCSVEEVLEAREAARARGGTSLDAPLGDEEGATVGDLFGGEDVGFERIDAALLADALIATLPDRDQVIVRLRFQQELTQHEIGRRIGCSQMQVSRLLRAALTRLRAEARGAGLAA